MRRTKRRGNALFRKVKQLYSTIVRKKIKGYSKNHKIFSQNEPSQGRKGLGRGKNAIDSARAAGANAATRRAKSGRKATSSEKAPRRQSPAARKPPSYSLRPRRRGKCGHTPGEKRAKSDKLRKSSPVPKTGRPEAALLFVTPAPPGQMRPHAGRKATSSEKAPRRQRPAARKPPSYYSARAAGLGRSSFSPSPSGAGEPAA